MLLIGMATAEITPFVKGIGMMGWCKPGNNVDSIESPLFARASVIENEKSEIFAFVNAEIAMITIILRQEVLSRLKNKWPQINIPEENIMLTAQHTHSAPGGYSQYVLYNLTIPGFSQEVLDILADGITQSIVDAWKKRTSARLVFKTGEFNPRIDVAFNRSLEAFNQNPENLKIDKDQTHLAIDRSMQLLQVEDAEGHIMGSMNWFSVHTTSVHNDKFTISSDNKGFAATMLEELINRQQQTKDAVAMFSQTHAGDVTPNNWLHKGDKEKRGPTPDDYENKKINGTFQAEKAWEIMSESGKEISGDIDSILAYFDFSNIEVHPDFVNGKEGLKTTDPCFGVRFIGGTAEGMGASNFLVKLVRSITRFSHSLKKKDPYTESLVQAQSAKTILINCARHEFVGTNAPHKMPLPDFVDPFIAELRRLSLAGVFNGEKPLVPTILPVQITTIGSLAIVGTPAEFTTTAGRRIKKLVLESLKEKGITDVIFSGYANAYSSYVSTPEEYRLQMYEGSSTLFGEYTLPAYQTICRALCSELLKPKNQRADLSQLQPHTFTEKDFESRTFTQSFEKSKIR